MIEKSAIAVTPKSCSQLDRITRVSRDCPRASDLVFPVSNQAWRVWFSPILLRVFTSAKVHTVDRGIKRFHHSSASARKSWAGGRMIRLAETLWTEHLVFEYFAVGFELTLTRIESSVLEKYKKIRTLIFKLARVSRGIGTQNNVFIILWATSTFCISWTCEWVF